MSEARVYQLTIIYPEGSHEPGWRPACWDDPQFLATLSRKARRELGRQEFCWPRERRFLSSSGAYGRAGLLRWYGADVMVTASGPVTWPAPGPRRWEEGDTAALWCAPMEKYGGPYLEAEDIARFREAVLQ